LCVYINIKLSLLVQIRLRMAYIFYAFRPFFNCQLKDTGFGKKDACTSTWKADKQVLNCGLLFCAKPALISENLMFYQYL